MIDFQCLALTSDQFLGLYNYWIVIFLMMTGFYIVIARKNMIKTIIGLNIFQTSVFLLYITMGKINHKDATAPIILQSLVPGEREHSAEHATEQTHDVIENAVEHAVDHGGIIYSNPLPSVLMLTAIVVGIATTALALALVVRIREDYGTIEEDEILLMDRES